MPASMDRSGPARQSAPTLNDSVRWLACCRTTQVAAFFEERAMSTTWSSWFLPNQFPLQPVFLFAMLSGRPCRTAAGLRTVAVRIEDALHRVGHPVDHVYFPTSKTLGLYSQSQSQRHRMIRVRVEGRQKYHTCRFNRAPR